MEFVGFKEAGDLLFGRLRPIGGVDQVFLDAHAEVPANSARLRLSGIGDAHDFSHRFDALESLPHRGDDRRGHHEGLNEGEKGFVHQMSVVLID